MGFFLIKKLMKQISQNDERRMKNEEWQMIIIKLIHILLVYKVLNLLNFLLFEGYGITP